MKKLKKVFPNVEFCCIVYMLQFIENTKEVS